MKRISDSHRTASMDGLRACGRVLSSASLPGQSLNFTAAELSDDDETRWTRPRYITEDLIKKLTKQQNLSFVHCLNLSTAHGDQSFRYIENLDSCDRVQILNFNNNIIEKMEKMERLHQLRELHLSNNRIRKIEGLEHMTNLQILDLACNRIEHVPMWLGKKLKSLRKLNLQKNKIFSLHELTKLKLLKSLTELMLAENPVSDLPHYRLFLVFHLRSLEFLDGQPISEQEREKAQQRFHTEELERLELELEERGAELERLKEEKAVALKELEHQEKLQQSLKQQSQEHQWRQEQLEMELDTKSELLKQKTAELTRACQKQYQLEQELAFHNIDAKFDPLPFDPDHTLCEDVLDESPYIGKARHKRNPITDDHVDTGHRLEEEEEDEEESRHDLARGSVAVAEKRLQQLCKEMNYTEDQILRANQRLRQIPDVEKDRVRQQLHMKIQKLREMQQEAEALEKQLDRQKCELSETQEELEQLQSLLQSLSPEDLKHAHIKAQLSSKNQLLSIMSRKQHELEWRLDDLLNRITNETQEIKDLEQQLTEGQIAVNEALKRDLENVVSGLQDYLHGVKDQARQAQSDCLHLQKENTSLQQLLWDKDQQLSQLQQVAQICENTKEELLQHQEELQSLRRENLELKEAQAHVSAYEADVQTELQERGCEISRLKEELSRLNRLSQLEHSALQAELQKERQAKENALVQLQLAAESELENTDLLQQLNILQREKGSLMEKVGVLQKELQQNKKELLCPKTVTKSLQRLKRSIATGARELSKVNNDGDVLSESLAELQEELHRKVSAALRDRDAAQSAQERLTNELEVLRNKFTHYQQKYQSAWEESQQDRIKAEEIQTQRQLQALELEITELKRSVSSADHLAAEQLHAAKDQLVSLYSTVHRISQERAEDAKELEESRIQATQALQDLIEAEREIHKLQKLLQHRFDLSDADSRSEPHTDVQQQELSRLSRVLKRQQTQTERLRDQLTVTLEDNSENLHELIEEIEALRENLLQQSNYLSRFTHSNGAWCYPQSSYISHQSFGSQATQDSGLGSHYVPLPSRHKHSKGEQHREPRPCPSSGYWVYSPQQQDQHNYGQRESLYRNCNGESDDDGVRDAHFTPPAGSIIYTMPPSGTYLPPGMVIYAPPLPDLSVGPGTVFYGPPPEGVRLVYGPPPSGLPFPLISNATLHCNIPAHLEMSYTPRVAENPGREDELLRLKEQKSDLQMELKELQQTVSQIQRSKLLESSVNSEEKDIVMNEVKRLEKTYSERRIELKEVERLLSEAERNLREIRAETRDTTQQCSEAQRKLKDTEFELQEMKQQTQDSTRQLEHTKQELRDLQEEIKNLQTYTQDQESTLKQVEDAIAARDAEFQDVNINLKRVTNKMEGMQKELRETQRQEANSLMGCRNAEDVLYTHRQELEHLKVQVQLQKDQLSLLGRKLEQWREEEVIVKVNVEKQRQRLVDVLRRGEEDGQELQQRIKCLAVEKEELDSQLSERKEKLTRYKKEQKKVQEKILSQRAVITKHKSELKRVLDLIQMESVELERVKLQHNQQLNQLEKSQEDLLQLRLELQEVKKEVQEQQGEREKHRELHEQEILTLKAQINAAAMERSSLMEECTGLEERRSHAHRCQESAAEGTKKAEAELLKLQTELSRLKQDYRRAQNIQKEVTRDAATARAQLEEKSKDLNKLKEEISHSSFQLKNIRKEVEEAQRQQDDFIKQQQHRKAVMEDKIHRKQQRINKLEQQLEEIETSVEKKELQFEQHQERLMIQQQQSLELEELQRLQQQKLQSQLQTLEDALLKRVEKMEQVTVTVKELEEQRRLLLADQQQCVTQQDRIAQLERDLAESETRLCASRKEQRETEEKLEAFHSDIQILQKALSTVGEPAGTHSLTDRDKLQQDKLWGCGEDDTHIQSHADLPDTICFLGAEVQAELELQHNITSDTNHETSSALNMRKSSSSSRDEQWRGGEVLRDKLRQHEDNLKAQLRRCMFSQQEALSLRRQQMDGSIQGLRKRVDKLDQLLSDSEQDLQNLSDTNILPRYVCLESERRRPQREQERSLSPVRLDITIPEKDHTHTHT